MRQKSNFIQFLIFIFLSLCLLNVAIGDDTKWLAIGQLHNWHSSAGCEVEVGRRHLIPDQQDGLRWPAQFKYQDSQAAKALWIGTTNYADPIANKTFSYKVVHIGPRAFDEENEFMPVEFKLIGKDRSPFVSVDGIPASNMTFMDLIDEIDPDLKADRLLYNVVNTSIGITMTRKIYAFGQQYHDNYFVFDYVFKNTGIVDKKGTRHDQTLEGVIFFLQYRYAPSRESGPYGYYFAPQNTSWGRNTMNDVVGEDPNAGDPFRAHFSWHGRHSGWKGPGDEIGAPYFEGDGHITAPQYVGVVTIHADHSASDNSDDPLQPTTTYYFDSDGTTSSGNDQFNADKMAAEYEDMSKGHPPFSHAEAVGDGNADEFGNTPGGYSQAHGFGPYTLAPGDSIHIVLAEGAAGLDRELCYLIGDMWKNKSSEMELPDGTPTSDENAFKNAWVFSGKDSLFQSFERAITTYNQNFDIPTPPPPPDKFEVISGGNKIMLQWSNNAESWPGFAGYRLYRAIHTPDTTFQEIFSCGPGVNSFDDITAARGFDYYYYIVSFDDGSNNTGQMNPTGSLQSSLFYTRTNEPAFLKRPAGTVLEQIRVVPNPFNINARDLQYGKSGADRLMFLDIPPFCKIKIFTERGDLIHEIDHVDGSGDEAWNSITSSRQTVVSGVYIAYFEVTRDAYHPTTGDLIFNEGDHIIRKFVIIR